MIKIFKFALIAAITMATPFACALETNPKREHRSAWITPLASDWPANSNAKGTTVTAANYSKAEIDKIIANAKANNMTALYVHMRPYADRLFAKTSYGGYTLYEPASHYWSGTRGTENTNYDPLEYWVEKAHAAGIELYAWVNPYRMGLVTGDQTATLTKDNFNYVINTAVKATADDKSVFDWLIINYNKGEDRTYLWFNPCLSTTKSRITTVCRVLVGNYDIDGIIFDDYFYMPGGYPETTAAADYQTWKNSGTSLSLGDWRRSHANDLIKQCYDVVHSIKPWVRFAVGPAGVATKGLKSEDDIPPLSNFCNAGDWQYDQIYADPLAWMREQTVDFLSPQIYWRTTSATSPYEQISRWWGIAAQKFGRPVWPSGYVSSYAGSSDTETTWAEINKEVEVNRNWCLDDMPGYVNYSAKYVLGPTSTNTGTYLAANAWKYPSLTPAMTWFNAEDPGRVTNLSKGDAKLTFDAMPNMRYVAYAVPQSVSPADAASEQGGYKAEYIIGTSYTNSIDIPAGKRQKADYWHAVAPLDRYGNEWPATTINAPIVGDCEVNLVSPTSDVTAETTQTFTWTGTAGATFTFEISVYEDFRHINLTKTQTNTSFAVNFTTWAPGLKLYWRVKASKSMMNDVVSEVRTITVPGETNLPLYVPVTGATATADISFVCQDVNCASYTLQVSRQSGFGTLAFEGSSNWEREVNAGTYWLQRTVPISLFTDGNYFWRVLGKDISGNIIALSETRSLCIDHGVAATGDYTPWHEDYEHYAATTVGGNKTLLTNLWSRNADHNATGFNGIFCRGMVARPADVDQDGDIIYVSARTANDQTASTWLYRFDASTGAQLSNLQLTYAESDTDYGKTFPNNGVILDNANHLIVHNLTTGNAPVYVGIVNPSSGMVTKKITLPVSTRVDHIDVWGDVNTGNYYVIAASSGNKMYRWHIVNNAINETKTYDLNLSTAPRVHAVSADRVWVDGSGTKPMLFDFTTGAVVSNGTLTPTIDMSGNGVCTFEHGGQSFIVYNSQHANGTSSSHEWTVATINNHTVSAAGHGMQWVLPDSYSMGISTDNGGDHGAPVSVLQHSSNARSVSDDNTTHIFMMSPANGIAGYAMTSHIVTGVDDIAVDNVDNSDAAPVYYNLQGIQVPHPTHGIYIERRGNTTRKIRR